MEGEGSLLHAVCMNRIIMDCNYFFNDDEILLSAKLSVKNKQYHAWPVSDQFLINVLLYRDLADLT